MGYDEDSPNQRGTPYVQGLFGRRDREGGSQSGSRKSWPLPFALALTSSWPQSKPGLGHPCVLPSHLTACIHPVVWDQHPPTPTSEESAASSAPAVCSRPFPPHTPFFTLLALLPEPSRSYLIHTSFLSPSMPSLCPWPSGETDPTTFPLFPRMQNGKATADLTALKEVPCFFPQII